MNGVAYVNEIAHRLQCRAELRLSFAPLRTGQRLGFEDLIGQRVDYIAPDEVTATALLMVLRTLGGKPTTTALQNGGWLVGCQIEDDFHDGPIWEYGRTWHSEPIDGEAWERSE